MPSPIIHLGVAIVALLLYFDDRHRKYVLLLLPFAVLPDLDHFVPYAPRVVFHNLFLLVLPVAIALYGLKMKNKMEYGVALMAGFCLFSHLMLDGFDGGEALFYPLQTMKYGVTNSPFLAHAAHGAVILVPTSFARRVSSTAFGIILVFVALAAILLVERRLQFNSDVRVRAEQT